MRAVLLITAMLVALSGHSEVFAGETMPPVYARSIEQRVPADHWRYVTSVTLVDKREYGATYHDRRIELPKDPDDRILFHEIGHVVGIVRPDLVENHWRQFVHRKNDRHESFAEGYRSHIEGRTRENEREWWATLVFERPLLTDTPRVVAVNESQLAPPSRSICTRADVPSGSIVAGCTGH
jgi:hypothetical protein